MAEQISILHMEVNFLFVGLMHWQVISEIIQIIRQVIQRWIGTDSGPFYIPDLE